LQRRIVSALPCFHAFAATMFDQWGSRWKTFVATLPVTAIVAYLFVSRRRRAALCAGGEDEVTQAQAEQAKVSQEVVPSSTERERSVLRRSEGVKALKKCEDEKLQLSRPQLSWSYSAGSAPVLLGPGGMVDPRQNKVMSPQEKMHFDLMLKQNARSIRGNTSGTFEAAKAKKAKKEAFRKEKEIAAQQAKAQAKADDAQDVPEVDVLFEKANELSVAELEAMILKTEVPNQAAGKAKKAKKPKSRKKKAPGTPEPVEVAEEAAEEVPEPAEEGEELIESHICEAEVEQVEEAEVAEVIEETQIASPMETPMAEEEPMRQVRSRKLRRRRRKEAEAAQKVAELAVAAAVEAAMAHVEEAPFKEMVSEDTTMNEADEPSEDRDATDADGSSSDAKDFTTKSESLEDPVPQGASEATTTEAKGTWHRTELTTTRKKWADLVDSDDGE